MSYWFARITLSQNISCNILLLLTWSAQQSTTQTHTPAELQATTMHAHSACVWHARVWRYRCMSHTQELFLSSSSGRCWQEHNTSQSAHQQDRDMWMWENLCCFYVSIVQVKINDLKVSDGSGRSELCVMVFQNWIRAGLLQRVLL